MGLINKNNIKKVINKKFHNCLALYTDNYNVKKAIEENFKDFCIVVNDMIDKQLICIMPQEVYKKNKDKIKEIAEEASGDIFVYKIDVPSLNYLEQKMKNKSFELYLKQLTLVEIISNFPF